MKGGVGWRGVKWSIGLMIYCTRFLEIKGRERNESERQHWKHENLNPPPWLLSSIVRVSCLQGTANYNLSSHRTIAERSFSCFSFISQSGLVGHYGGAGPSPVEVDFRLEGESGADNDSHCSSAWGVEAWEMTHREEWRNRGRREGELESFEEIKSQEWAEKGCEIPYSWSFYCLISSPLSQH